MSITTLIPLALKASVFLNLFAVGLNARPQDSTYLFLNPGRLGRSLLSMFVFMPLFAAALAFTLDIHPAVKIALVALAVAPIPPLLPKKLMEVCRQSSFAIGLLVAAALLSIAITPIAVNLLGRAFGAPVQMTMSAITRVILLTVIIPLGAGMIVRGMAPRFAGRWLTPIAVAATALLIAGATPILFTAWPTIETLIGDSTMIAIVAFVSAGLTVGHLLGGPNPEDRSVLALSTASRHPGIAMAIATANFPGQKLTPAAILLYLIVSAIVSLPYLAWRKRRQVESQGGIPAYRNLSRSR